MRSQEHGFWAKNHRLARVAAFVALCAPLSACVETDSSLPDRTPVPYETVSPTPTLDAAPLTCDDPKPRSLKAIKQLFRDVEVVDLDEVGPDGQPVDVTQRLIDSRREAAKKFGLTIYDYRTETADLSNDVYRDGPSKIDISVYLKRLKEFSDRYGIDLSIPKKSVSNAFDIPVSPIDFSAFTKDQDRTAKMNILSFIGNLGELPVEFVRSTGLEKVYLVGIEEENVGGFADYLDGGIFYVDLTKQLQGQTFNHELFHLWDAAQCGNGLAVFEDPGFVSLNPETQNPISGIYVGEAYDDPKLYPRPYTSYEAVLFSNRADKLIEAINIASAYGNDAKRKRLWSAYNALFANVVVSSNYGFANAAEDKATIGEDILSPYRYGLQYDRTAPMLLEKFYFLFARMYEDDPRVAQYFEAVGNTTWS